jgi:hypothetical protein
VLSEATRVNSGGAASLDAPCSRKEKTVSDATSQGGPRTIQLTDRQYWIIRMALQEYLASFSHTEGEIIEEVKALLLTLPGGDNVDPNRNLSPGKTLTL